MTIVQDPITATLEEWIIQGSIAYGRIYGDTKERFNDGEYVRTSTILMRDGDTIFTRNSIYKLGTPAQAI